MEHMKFFYINPNDAKKFIFKQAGTNADRINSFTYLQDNNTHSRYSVRDLN